MPTARPAYPAQFRHEAVQRCEPAAPGELAESLGVSEQTLRNWRRQHQRDRHERDDGLTSDERDELRRLRPENARLKQELTCSNDLRPFRSGDRDPVTVYRMISAEKASTPVSVCCRLLGMSRSGCYDWERRAPSDRALSDAFLIEKISEIWAGNRKSTAPRAFTPSCG